MGKTNPLNDNDMKEFLQLQRNFEDSEKSWTIDVEDLDTETLDLSVKNPNVKKKLHYVVLLKSSMKSKSWMKNLEKY